MIEDIGVKIVFWLIMFTGALTITYGCLHWSLVLFGRIIKLLGMWGDTTRIMVRYYQEKRAKKRK